MMKSGDLDVPWFILQVSDWYKRRNIPNNYFYDETNMNQIKIDLKAILENKNIHIEQDLKRKETVFGDETNNDNLFKNIRDSKVILGKSQKEIIGRERIYETVPFSEILKLENKQKDKALLGDFSTDKMSEMISDMYSSDFVQNMMFGMEKSKKQEEPSKRIEEGTIDVLYSNKSEELSMEQETPTEKTSKMPIDIVPETLDFNVGEKLIQTAEDQKTSSVVKIADIRRLIEMQGHREDIVATIAKISEIGKNGIVPNEQGKKVEGSTQSEQNPDTPSDEEKE